MPDPLYRIYDITGRRSKNQARKLYRIYDIMELSLYRIYDIMERKLIYDIMERKLYRIYDIMERKLIYDNIIMERKLYRIRYNPLHRPEVTQQLRKCSLGYDRRRRFSAILYYV